jgi:hypothetical protein
MAEILVCRLLSGEEILGEVEDHNLTYHIKNPCVVQFGPPAPGSQECRVAVMPLLPYADQDFVEIQKSLVVFTFKPVEQIAGRHRAIYGSGLILPNSNIQKA